MKTDKIINVSLGAQASCLQHACVSKRKAFLSMSRFESTYDSRFERSCRQDTCAPSLKNMNLFGVKPGGIKHWYNRGYLPHFDGGEIMQFITFRLHDSLPQEVLLRWRRELERESEIEREILLNHRIEKYLDQGFGKCLLREPEIAAIAQNAVLFHDKSLYKLSAWVIMPNHVHLLLTPNADIELSQIMHSIKSFTSNKINQAVGRKGKLWQEESFDRYIRDRNHYEKTIAYIENNPVKAGLCEKPGDWQFSSELFRSQHKN